MLSGDYEARDLLPARELATLDNAIADAVRFTRMADRPKAAALLGQAYYTFVEGRGEPGSLFEELARHGLSDAIVTPLKAALAMASREEAASDEVVIAVAQLRRRYVDALDAYGTALAAGGGMPIRLDVRSARDTTGTELSLLPAVAGEVMLPAVPTLEVVVMEPTPERVVGDEGGSGADGGAEDGDGGVSGVSGEEAASGDGGADGEGGARDEADADVGSTGAGAMTGRGDGPAPFPRRLDCRALHRGHRGGAGDGRGDAGWGGCAGGLRVGWNQVLGRVGPAPGRMLTRCSSGSVKHLVRVGRAACQGWWRSLSVWVERVGRVEPLALSRRTDCLMLLCSNYPATIVRRRGSRRLEPRLRC